jgi:hypothetical protein
MTAVLHVFCQGVSRIQSGNFIARSMPGSGLSLRSESSSGSVLVSDISEAAAVR